MNTLLNQLLVLALLALAGTACTESPNNPEDNLPDISGFPIVGTAQNTAYSNTTSISTPSMGEDFYGQNANYPGTVPQYVDNGDGTITDMVTGLMWSQSPDLDGDGEITAVDKLTYEGALASAASFDLAGYGDWRIPTIKELYSLILFSGIDPSGYNGTSTDGLVPFIDTDFFEFGYGDTEAGERIIDAQMATSTKYVDFTMMGDETMFGVNFADGRIKGYGLSLHGNDKSFYVYYVRGNEDYGINDFLDNGDGTITDKATGLMWMQNDADQAMNWEEALVYAEGMEFAGYSDWRLPDVKELQGIVDYTRSPATSNSPAMDPMFSCTSITNEAGQTDYSYYWSSTTHASWAQDRSGSAASYVTFGRATGYMNGSWLDVHGAGAQRSDPKVGDPSDYPTGHGPQGDAIRVYNQVRLVRYAN